jgi:hypothetical protein
MHSVEWGHPPRLDALPTELLQNIFGQHGFSDWKTFVALSNSTRCLRQFMVSRDEDVFWEKNLLFM